MKDKKIMAETIVKVTAKDIRFPTSLEKHGSDAMHPDPDYSCAYVILETEDATLSGHGLTFTIGRGTEVVVACINSLTPLIVGKKIADLTGDMASFYRLLSSDSQLRWIGPEKGVIHLATSCLINAVWDLWAKIEGKPLWKLLVDMTPEQLVSTIDFRYLSDVLTKEEAIEMLQKSRPYVKARIDELSLNGYPAYTTTVGWLGYSDQTVRENCRKAMLDGYTRFKAKVGDNLEDDKKRLALIRSEIGPENLLMVDANQKWDVDQAISWMKQLAPFHPLWIEEPTSPDDILGHAKIAKELNPLGIGVATGEQCHNRVMFKQFLSSGGMQFCQVDATRLGGVNEVLAVLLMANKLRVPVCPHAGGVGLCEYVPHLAIFDYICVSGSLRNRMTEFADHLHEHFRFPPVIINGNYAVPPNPGYCGQMYPESMAKYEFPHGSYWAGRQTNPKTY